MIPNEGFWDKNERMERPLSPHVTIYNASFSTTATSENIIRKIIPNEGFWDKNERMKRPMSPHITIYRFPLPAVLSISHRITGVALSGLAMGMGVGALVLPGTMSGYVEMIQALNIPIWATAPAKMILLWPLVYHGINGIRHLTWDTGRAFDMKTIYTSGIAVVAISLAGAAGIVAYCL